MCYWAVRRAVQGVRELCCEEFTSRCGYSVKYDAILVANDVANGNAGAFRRNALPVTHNFALAHMHCSSAETQQEDHVNELHERHTTHKIFIKLSVTTSMTLP